MSISSMIAYAAPLAPAAKPSLSGVWTRIEAMLLARRTRTLLGNMDGHMLADIGVSHATAQSEAARPFWDLGAGLR